MTKTITPPAWRESDQHLDKKLHDWAYEILEEWWNSGEWQLEQTLGSYDPKSPLADEIAMTAADNLEYGPLANRLRSGRAPLQLLRWIADGIESGYFARRKTKREKLSASPVQRAALDVADIEILLQRSYPDQKAIAIHEKALLLAAMHHAIDPQSIGNLHKRSKKDRRRIK